jgi:DUF1680 family protein
MPGHLYESAVAHYMATKKRNLLDIALKNADLVCSVFGPGKKHVAPGHEIIEMGLVKLYRVTGKKEYLETAKFFVKNVDITRDMIRKARMPGKTGLTGRMISLLRSRTKLLAMQFAPGIYMQQLLM